MPAAQPDKVIVSNLKRLTQKYKASGVTAVKKALKKLIAADATRGLVTIFVDLSNAATMGAYGVPALPAAAASDPKRNKAAIDAIFAHGDSRPSYLMVLGSIDVVPHVPLVNPMAGDGDADVPSDLPYASDKPYSTDAQDFIAPTRVVGRLPNVTNDTDAAYLVGLLDTAATYTSRPAADYQGFLGITAQVWKKSTEMSLDAVFGNHAGMKVSPPDGYKWTAAEAKRLMHLVNCHGADTDPNFYGQKGGAYPVAHSAAWMAGKVAPATVLAAECCYGAQLYDPATPATLGQMGLCNTYLGRMAYAYLGSSNIAYGPSDSNDQADLLCQLFLKHVLAEASVGRACLQARLDYALGKGGSLGPTDLKTLAQFNLMADPSLTPVSAATHGVAIQAGSGAKTKSQVTAAVARHARLSRRVGLEARSAGVVAHRLIETDASFTGKTATFAKLRKMAAEFGIKSPEVVLSYAFGKLERPAGAKGVALRTEIAGEGPKAVHVLFERHEPRAGEPRLTLIRGVQAMEYADSMVARPFESR